MNFGFLVKANNNIFTQLLKKFNVPKSLIIFRESETNDEVEKSLWKR